MVSTTNTGHDDARQPPPSTKGSTPARQIKPAKEKIAPSAETEQAQEQDAVAGVADVLKAAADCCDAICTVLLRNASVSDTPSFHSAIERLLESRNRKFSETARNEIEHG
ncbi:hypothetical protein N7535_005334 [Penicillium sp. DV-2018c]|nr:hypothetical protein N7461_008915 [Penicillium sp. DV-2018c]KAJ5571674.1 hypothetical protein N7535_005334 [Penicillium sp. DV-2018c]